MMGMALGIIPISLAWAMVRDRYDEDLLGKKGNVLDFGEADPFLVLLDRLDRVGTPRLRQWRTPLPHSSSLGRNGGRSSPSTGQ